MPNSAREDGAAAAGGDRAPLSATAHAAFCGAAAWGCYAIVEALCLVVWPRLADGAEHYRALSASYTALLFGLYPLLGAGIGLGIAAGLRIFAGAFWAEGAPADRRRVVHILCVASLPAFYLLNLYAHWYWDPMLLVPAALALLVVGATLAFGASSKGRFERVRFLCNGFSVSLLLLAAPQLPDALGGLSPVASRAVATGLLCLVFVAAALLVARRVPGDSAGPATSRQLRTRALALCSVAVAVVMTNGLLRQAEPVDENEPAAAAAPRPPNVVIVSWDTVRADHLSLYGYEYETSPQLEKLARDSIVFRNAYAPGNMTLTSHASLFTGLYVRGHGAHYHHPEFPDGKPLAESFTTLAEALSANDYATYAVIANNAYLTRDFGMDQGFGYFDSREPVVLLAKPAKHFFRRFIRDVVIRFSTWLPLVPRAAFDKLYRNAEEINEELFAVLDRAQATGRPFFLFANLMDAHDPYIPPAPYDGLVPGKDDRFVSAKFHAIASAVLIDREPVDESDRQHMISQYDGGIAYLDAELGRLVEGLKQRGLYDDTLLVVLADHGEVFGDKNLFGHAVSLYQDQIHVPLVVKLPGQAQTADVEQNASLVDVLPTVMEGLGLDAPPGLHGVSLLDRPADAQRNVVSEHYRPGHSLEWGDWFGGAQRALISESTKLISKEEPESTELFDLASDPTERQDLSTQRLGTQRSLLERLKEWLRLVQPGAGGSEGIDEKTRQRLEALGYI